jgi:hypothetical protein
MVKHIIKYGLRHNRLVIDYWNIICNQSIAIGDSNNFNLQDSTMEKDFIGSANSMLFIS